MRISFVYLKSKKGVVNDVQFQFVLCFWTSQTNRNCKTIEMTSYDNFLSFWNTLDCIGLLKGLEKDLENTQKKIDKYSEISGEHLPDVANPSTDVLNVLKCMEGWRDEVLVQQSKLVRLERQQENVRKERLIRVENLLKKT